MTTSEQNGATPPSLGDVLDELNNWKSRQERLRDSVDEIETQLKERKKPWYRSATTIMSVAGSLFALISGVYTLNSAHIQKIDKSAADLETIVDQLIQLHAEENQDLSTAKSDFASYSARSSLRNTKRVALQDEARTKIETATPEVSPSILIVLAGEEDVNGAYETAYEYLTLAVKKSASGSPAKVSALFNLAALCLTDGKVLCKSGQGKASYLAALNEQPGNSDNTHYERGQLLVNISLLLHNTNPEGQQAGEYMDQADSEAALITPVNPLRQRLTEYIATGRTFTVPVQSPQTASFSNPATFVGKWDVTYSNDSSKVGTITFVQLPAFPFYGAFLEVFQNGRLVEKQEGQVQVLDPRTLRMDWTSLGISGQTAGYSLFALLSSGPRMSAEQYRLGESKSVLALKQRVLEAKKDDRLLHEVAGH